MNLFLLAFVTVFTISAYGSQNTISDANIDVSLNYPDVVAPGNEFVLASTVKTKADQMSNITVTIGSPELEIVQNQFNIPSLPRESTLGNNFNAKIKPDSPDGIVVANISIEYFIKGFFDEKPIKNSLIKAFEINVQSKPIILINIDSPDSVFSGEQFSIKGTIKNQGYDAQNIEIIADSPQVMLDGKKIYAITNLDAGRIQNFEFVLQTPKDLAIPTDITVNISTTYSDKSGKTYSQEDALNIFTRQRGILEIGGAEGLWVGDFFIAPVVGVGTIVSSVIGFFIFLWHIKNKKKQKRTKK
ncbi:MAG TPA: hypothetical protein VLB45_01275 [Nitrosopumilaceae archaeon]|nr:hypothetical protein [Nitrosopumilaceae archaeon]